MRGVRAEGTAHGECGARSGRAVRARVDRGPAGGAVRRGGGAATLRRPRAPAHERQLAKRSNPGTGGAPRGRAPRQMREATPPAESDSLIEELWKLVRLYRGESVFPEGGAPDETEVVVVLGTQVLSGGRPSGTLRARVQHAARLYAKGEVRLVVPTGGVGRHPPSEAEVAARILRGAGVPEEAILPEREARNTRESARLVAAMAKERGIRSVVVV